MNIQNHSLTALLDLPPPVQRRHLHDRCITFQGYLRDDGLWDIEGELRDSKTYAFPLGARGDLAPGELIHHMRLRLTVDDQMVIRDIAAAMLRTPYAECPPAIDTIRAVIGLQMGRGWKKKIESVIGGVQGCTHMRELLAAAATATFQTMYSYRSQQSGVSSDQVTEPPKYLHQCKAWDLTGPVVMRYFPQFARSSRLE